VLLEGTLKSRRFPGGGLRHPSISSSRLAEIVLRKTSNPSQTKTRIVIHNLIIPLPSSDNPDSGLLRAEPRELALSMGLA
jgi:hypothetical protein